MCASAWEKIPEKVRRPSLLLQILHLYLRRNRKFLRCFKASSQHSLIRTQPANNFVCESAAAILNFGTFGNLSRLSRLSVERAVDSGDFGNLLFPVTCGLFPVTYTDHEIRRGAASLRSRI